MARAPLIYLPNFTKFSLPTLMHLELEWDSADSGMLTHSIFQSSSTQEESVLNTLMMGLMPIMLALPIPEVDSPADRS